jgi:hypothetical protein
LLTTVIATPIVIAMEGVALGAGALSATGNIICDKVLSSKAKEHYQIMMLAQSKLSTISDHISKALKDNEICDEEFTLILSEIDKYNQLKEDFRSKTKTKLGEETKESLIKQGKEKAIEEFSTMLAPMAKLVMKLFKIRIIIFIFMLKFQISIIIAMLKQL